MDKKYLYKYNDCERKRPFDFACSSKYICVDKCPTSYFNIKNVQSLENIRNNIICRSSFNKWSEIIDYDSAKNAVENGYCIGEFGPTNECKEN